MYKVAILISGTGSNMESVLNYESVNKDKFKVTKVIANKEAKGIDIAKSKGYEAFVLNKKELGQEKYDELLFNSLDDVDIIVLAGYLAILDKKLVEKFSGRIINIHPSLLPKFGGKGMYGLNVHKAVVDAKEEFSGCTVHLVDEGVDTGEILIQKQVRVLKNDTAESLQKRILKNEHIAIVEGLEILIDRMEN